MQSPSFVGELELIVRQAGRLLMSFYQKAEPYSHKEHEIAAQAERSVEQFLIEKLALLCPQACFYAEESGVSGNQQSPYCWVIDPLDGTTNFIHGFPYFCISVALAYNHKPVVGVIYQPVLDELFYAKSGQGAWLNGACIADIHTKQSYNKKVIATSWWAHQAAEHVPYTVRYCGAVALDSAYVAGGRLDGIIAQNVAWWDIAAGIVLLAETRHTITHHTENSHGKRGHTLVAGQAELHTLLYNTVFCTASS